MTEKFDAIIASVVEGQLKSYLHSHPEIAEACQTKLATGRTKADALRSSIAKRIVRDLTCPETKARLMGSLAESE